RNPSARSGHFSIRCPAPAVDRRPREHGAGDSGRPGGSSDRAPKRVAPAGGACIIRPLFDFDLLVIGSGPAGHRAAIQAAKLAKRVAVVEKPAVVGGVCINTGTIPSKTLREAALRLSGYRERGLYGASYSVKQHITMHDLLFRVDHVISNEIDVARHQ